MVAFLGVPVEFSDWIAGVTAKYSVIILNPFYPSGLVLDCKQISFNDGNTTFFFHF